MSWICANKLLQDEKVTIMAKTCHNLQHGKNSFVKLSKNFARYRFENKFNSPTKLFSDLYLTKFYIFYQNRSLKSQKSTMK